MKQLLYSFKKGIFELVDLPMPNVRDGALLVQSYNSLISSGTERSLVEFGKAGWINKARQQPDKVRMVMNKMKTDGLRPTIESVLNKLDQPFPMGYSNVGKIIEVGNSVSGFNKGDRVASNGNHAEFINVPQNLCAKIPNNVTNEEAAFTVVGAIALQGIRLAKPNIGETIVVSGLGLIGLITVQLLKANGCRVIGLDVDDKKLSMAKEFGAEVINVSTVKNPKNYTNGLTNDTGVDAVIVAAATTSSEPIHQAALMCRKRGRIVLVGVTGLELNRDDFFKKEITFQVSSSYGPGRYDPNYEEKGQDYPIGFVRWTEKRNFEAVLNLISDGSLNLKPLISHRFDINEAKKAYEILLGSQSSMGILLNYNNLKKDYFRTLKFPVEEKKYSKINTPQISFLGAGNYASSVLIPAFKMKNVKFKTIASAGGISGDHAGKKFGFVETTTDTNSLFKDKNTDAIVISTRHNSHAKFVLQALKVKKHIFVEKPLCLNLEELSKIKEAYNNSSVLMVGFNRRFAPHIQKIKSLLKNVSGPKSIVMTINAGSIASDHWIQDGDVGGGRIIGEVCHFIDLLSFITGAQIVSHHKSTMNSKNKDTVSLQFTFADGSIGTIHYFANGSKTYSKEHLEVYASGGILKMDNYRKLTGYGWPGFKKMNLFWQDKGQKSCVSAFVDAISKKTNSPISFQEIYEVSRISIELANT